MTNQATALLQTRDPDLVKFIALDCVVGTVAYGVDYRVDAYMWERHFVLSRLKHRLTRELRFDISDRTG